MTSLKPYRFLATPALVLAFAVGLQVTSEVTPASASSGPATASSGPAASVPASAPVVTVSPLAGTPDAAPSTQISFLGAPAADLSQIVVRGSRSGLHRGRLEAYADRDGASFLPSQPFLVGEHVTASAVVIESKTSKVVGTSFTIGALNPLAPDGPHNFPATPGSVLSFASAPSLAPPSVAVSTPAGVTASAAGVAKRLGDIFITPVYGDSQAGPMIVSPTGRLIWFKPEPANFQAANLRIQSYLGRPVLTYWQGQIAIGHGIGHGVILNKHYQQIATVHAGNGLVMDMHDFTLGPGGVAYITIFDPVHANLSAAGGPVDGLVEDSVVQEIDIRTGLVMWEWHSLGHVPLTDSHSVYTPGGIYDYFHGNTIQVLPNGNLIFNSRNTWATYEVSHASGHILWQVGGVNSSFKLGPGVRFAYQLDATLLPDGNLEIFDDEAAPQVRAQSRGLLIKLDFATHVASLLDCYTAPKQPILTDSQGDIQALPNGNVLLGYGQDGIINEFSSAHQLSFQMTFAPYVQSYRAYQFPWSATPSTKPAVAATNVAGATTTTVSASWNGATTVRGWRVLAGMSASAQSLHVVVNVVPSQGFETKITVPGTAPYVKVTALGVDGKILASSHAVAVAVAVTPAVAATTS